jgi:hypothetical protein
MALSDGHFVLILLQDYDLALLMPICRLAATRIGAVHG